MALAYQGAGPRSLRSYITTAAFNNSIYRYDTQLNTTTFKNEGRLVSYNGLTTPSGGPVNSTTCPKGRILREVGRKIFPGANPGLAVGDTYAGATVGTTATNHMWVLVMDRETGLRGFIDPNASLFALYNTDRPPSFGDAGEDAGGTPTRLGQSVYTAGDVIANGGVTATSRLTVGVAGSTTTAAQAATAYDFTATPYVIMQAATVSITATVPAAGSLAVLRVIGSTTLAVTLSTGFKGSATVSPGAGNQITVVFISDGTNLIEIARSAALLA